MLLLPAAFLASRIVLMTDRVPFSTGRDFRFANSTAVFLPSDPFPLGTRHTADGRNQSIEEFRSLQIENMTTAFQFPETKSFWLAHWRLPANLCPSPSFLLTTDFHITSRTTFAPVTDFCLFVDPHAVGHLIAITARSSRQTTVQYFVNNSNVSNYECKSPPNATLRCSSPFDQPFFVRIGGIAQTVLDLEIDYSIAYAAERQNDCFVSQIPTIFLRGEDSAMFQPQNYCATKVQENIRLAVKCAAVATVVCMIAVLMQWMGHFNFCGWMKMPRNVRGVMFRGSVSFDASVNEAEVALFGLLPSSTSESESSELSASRWVRPRLDIDGRQNGEG
jgi:hypothetical protein